MALAIPYAPLQTSAVALASAIGVSFNSSQSPPWTGAPSGESKADLLEAQHLLERAATLLREYAAKATIYNNREAEQTAAASEYSAATAAYTPALQAQWTEVDLSVRSAEQELTDAGVAGSWSPGVATTPTYDVAAVTARARTAAQGCSTVAKLHPVRDALYDAADRLELTDDNPPTLRATLAPVTPYTAPADELVIVIDQYVEYLAGS